MDQQYFLSLREKKYNCAQIMVKLGLHANGCDNSLPVKAATGFGGGLGRSQMICGTLTGSICLLSLVAGRGKDDETGSPDLNDMICELISWFEEEFGSTQCIDIAGEGFTKAAVCSSVMEQTYEKAIAILDSYGFSLDDTNFQLN